MKLVHENRRPRRLATMLPLALLVTTLAASHQPQSKGNAMQEMNVEIRVTGLAYFNTEDGRIHFVKTTKGGAHTHHPRMTFFPEDYDSPSVSTKFLRVDVGGNFQASIPLTGEVVVGLDPEATAPYALPDLNATPPPDLLGVSDIISLKELNYRKLKGSHLDKMVTSIQFVGGQLFAGKKIVGKDGKPILFDVVGGSRSFSEHIVWRKTLKNDQEFWIRYGGRDHRFRREGDLILSMTNLPSRGTLGASENRQYFKHLEMLQELGISVGKFKLPSESKGEKRLKTANSESCSPVKGP